MIKMISSMTLCTIGLLVTPSSHAEISFEQALQQGCAKVKQYASTGKKFYDQKQYKKALAQFKNQASWYAGLGWRPHYLLASPARYLQALRQASAHQSCAAHR